MLSARLGLRSQQGDKDEGAVGLEAEVRGEDFERGEVVVPLAWPVVQFESDLRTPRVAKVLHRRAFRDVLANEPIRVLVRAALPGVVRSGEVEGGAGGSFDLGVTVELGPVINGDGLEKSGMSADELDDATVRGSDRAGAELADKRAAGYAFDETDHAVTIKRADDRIHLPVADFLSQFDGGGAFGDVPFASQPATLLSTTVALSPLGRLSQELK